MANIFNSVMVKRPQRNHFDLSHDRKFSMDMGKLIPCLCQEVVPSDKFTVNASQMIRFAPMVAPVMHNIDVYTHFFFVPNRLSFPFWEEFITGTNPDIIAPYANLERCETSSIPDYLGVPTSPYLGGVNQPYPGGSLSVNAFPFAAYGRVWNEYYRDQNLQAQKDSVDLVEGENQLFLESEGLLGTPFDRCWEHDYFTSALPWAQKGDEVTVPLGTSADIVYKDPEIGDLNTVRKFDGTLQVDGDLKNVAGTFVSDPSGSGGNASYLDNSDNLEVDLSTATASSINDLRKAWKVQEWLEIAARGGSRYIEQIKAHFNQDSSDARLQRPEYLGGGKSPVMIGDVMQTSQSDVTPQGNLSGRGMNVGEAHSFTRTFEEHGFIIGIISVRPRTAYSQGLRKQMFRFERLDYLWPTFANIGEQEVLNKELYIDADTDVREGTFGYVPRYAEYRYIPSSVHGDMRDTLEYWQMARKFAAQPVLNEDFVRAQVDKRIFAVQNLPDDGTDPDLPVRNFDSLYCHMYLKIDARRPLPKWGVPSF